MMAHKTKPLRSFTMLAYNGLAMKLDGFPFSVVIDLAGMSGFDRPRPILLNHDTNQILGHTTRIQVSASSILVEGRFSAVNEAARETIAASDNEFPWLASIGASIQEASLVDEGETVTVNAREFNGPLIIALKTTLKEISFVPVAADDSTLVSVGKQVSAAARVTLELERPGCSNRIAAAGFTQSESDALVKRAVAEGMRQLELCSAAKRKQARGAACGAYWNI